MKHERMEVWRRSQRLSVDVYRELAQLRDFGFKDQITRSALSVPSNIAEGFERYSEREKFRFISIAKGSCGEFATQTLIGMEVGYITEAKGTHWRDEAFQLSRMLGALMASITRSS